MTAPKAPSSIPEFEQIPVFTFLMKWLLLSVPVGVFAGLSSALFLWLLDAVTDLRTENIWWFAGLPIAGLIIGWGYRQFGQDISGGNNLILQEFYQPKQIIHWKMAPMVLIGTLLTHLTGGSAGREGTAVQMSTALTDQLNKVYKFTMVDRKILLIMGISAGFAAVFGTPLAGAIFGIEVLVLGRMRYEAILPSLMAAILGHYVCTLTGIVHTHYYIDVVPPLAFDTLLMAILAGICFGLIAYGFSQMLSFFTKRFNILIKQPVMRPVAGGVLLAVFFLATGLTQYAGLGIPVIQSAFTEVLPFYDFILKSILTAFTLGAGFKGGEVTPLFYIGATAGNALAQLIPLPVALLAGMGFVGVFSGATNTPIACTLMGIELFGASPGVYLALACICAYFFSGHSGIYGSQMIGSPKHLHFVHYKGNDLKSIHTRKSKE